MTCSRCNVEGLFVTLGVAWPRSLIGIPILYLVPTGALLWPTNLLGNELACLPACGRSGWRFTMVVFQFIIILFEIVCVCVCVCHFLHVFFWNDKSRPHSLLVLCPQVVWTFGQTPAQTERVKLPRSSSHPLPVGTVPCWSERSPLSAEGGWFKYLHCPVA